MRFLRLDYRDDLHGLDLHPLLSVVSATEPTEVEQLLEAVRRISSGSTSGLRGLLEEFSTTLYDAVRPRLLQSHDIDLLCLTFKLHRLFWRLRFCFRFY